MGASLAGESPTEHRHKDGQLQRKNRFSLEENMNDPIHSTLVSENDRVRFLPKKCGNNFLLVEQTIYFWMKRLCPEYRGGYWAFYDLSNGGWFMKPDMDKCHMIWADNLFNEVLAAETAGIVATLYGLNTAIDWGYAPTGQLMDSYWKLRDFAYEHADGAIIAAAID